MSLYRNDAYQRDLDRIDKLMDDYDTDIPSVTIVFFLKIIAEMLVHIRYK